MTIAFSHPQTIPSVCSDIPTTFNPYKYGLAKTVIKYFEYGDIMLWIKTSIKRCSCGKQTPYVYKRTWFFHRYRICGNCMPQDVKELLEKIYFESV